jgi:hypothetical protein
MTAGQTNPTDTSCAESKNLDFSISIPCTDTNFAQMEPACKEGSRKLLSVPVEIEVPVTSEISAKYDVQVR